jgi:hypothetical protein
MANTGGNTSTAWVAPYASYQVKPTLAATAQMDLINAALAHGARYNEWQHTPTDVQLGAAWDVTPTVNVNPFVQVSTGGTINADSTFVGAYLSAKLL